MKHFLFIVLIAIGMVGCATERPTSTKSSNYQQDHSNKHTSKVTDSTLIDRLREVIIRNDTVYIHDSIYIFKWRDRQVIDSIHDTLYIEQRDSVFVPVEIEKIVEVDKPIPAFVRNSCIALWSIVGVAILALVVWIAWSFATGKFSWGGLIRKLLSVFFR